MLKNTDFDAIFNKALVAPIMSFQEVEVYTALVTFAGVTWLSIK